MPDVYRVPAQYTAGQLVYALRHARQHHEAIYQTPDGQRLDAPSYRHWFRQRLHAKINRGQQPRGRRDCADWFREAQRTARAVNTPRLIVRWAPADLRERLAHRLHRPEDD